MSLNSTLDDGEETSGTKYFKKRETIEKRKILLGSTVSYAE